MLGLFHRRPKLAAERRPRLTADERILAWADAPDGLVVVVTNTGLWLPRLPRLGWHEVHKAAWSGRELRITAAELATERDGYSVVIDRPAVSYLLLEPRDVPDQVRARVTKSVAYTSHHALPGGGGVRVVARRIAGTDGLHSAVRRHVNPGQVPRDTGLVASRGIVHFDHDTFHDDRSQIFTTRFARVVTYCMQGRESLRYWFAAYQHQGRPPHDRDSLLDLFSDLPEPVRAMMASTPQEAILTHPMHALSGTGPWHRGRAVLLGDSAHAMLPTMGYGLTLGLENGFMLAQALAGHCDEDLTTALRRYETRAARRSQAMIDVMQAMTDLYYFEPEGTVSGTRIEPIIGRFRDLTATTVF